VTIESLLDKENPMDIGRAKAVADVAGKIIDSAKVEVDHLRALDALGVRIPQNSDGATGTGFISTTPRLKAIK
jgi:hypothetical protein